MSEGRARPDDQCTGFDRRLPRVAAAPGEIERRNRAMSRALIPHVRAFYEAYRLDERARDPFYRPSSRV